jgi:hypothetical protein
MPSCLLLTKAITGPCVIAGIAALARCDDGFERAWF